MLTSTLKSAYLKVLNEPDNIISVFDDTRFDRSDIDLLSPSMRRHVLNQLTALGFKQVSGRVLHHAEDDIRCIMPKPSVLAASPFHITHYERKRPEDYYVLTSTQTACLMIDLHPLEQALEAIIDLQQSQPINVNKIEDYLDYSNRHKEFLPAIPHLRYQQRIAIEKHRLARQKPLTW